MTNRAFPAGLGQQSLPVLSPAAIIGRRAVLGGALSLALGASFPPSITTDSMGPGEGATIFSYGHSFARMPNPYVTRPHFDEYQLQLGRRLASGPVVSRGLSGTRLLDTVSAVIAPTFAGSSRRRWRIGDHGIVLLHSMMNDVSRQGGGDPDYLNAYQKALHLALGVFGADSFMSAEHASRRGAWTARACGRVEGGRTMSTRSHGDSITFTVRGDSVHVSTLCTDPRVITQGTLRAECNGVIVGYFGRDTDDGTHTCNRSVTYTDSVDRVSQNHWTPAGWRIIGLNAAAGTSGTKTVEIRKVDMSSAAVWVQGAYLPSNRAPRVLVAKEPPCNPATPRLGALEAFHVNEPSYRALIDAVCNEYRAAHSVDLRPFWDSATMVSDKDTASRFHPNTLGMSCIADNFERAVDRSV